MQLTRTILALAILPVLIATPARAEQRATLAAGGRAQLELDKAAFDAAAQGSSGQVARAGKLYFATDTTSPKSGPSEAAEAWNAIKDTTSVAVLDLFIQRYGSTFFGDLAKLRLEELKSRNATSPAQTPSQVDAISPVQPPPAAPSGLPGGMGTVQSALLYDEDPNNPKGKQYPGTVAWRTNPVKSANRPDDIEVFADIDIPSRRLKMTMALRRNTDTSLPASHVIELKFNFPADFAGGGIGSVPGILMKTSEHARGVALSALSVKVTDGYFMVGLSNVSSERARNVESLTQRTWFDVPMVYANQRRAILAIEKGSAGDQAFRAAFASWGEVAPQ